MRILIIDDDLAASDDLQQLILNVDPAHEIDSVHSSYEALQLLRKHKFDIIFTEVYLQGGIQGNQIITTAADATFKIGMAEELDNPTIRQPFNHFIVKPITVEHIKQAFTMAKYNIDFLTV